MRKTTFTEEINRIIQISEYGYDYDDVSRQSSHKPIDVSNLSGKNINKNTVTNWISRHKEEDQKKEKVKRETHLLDINNHKDRMVIFNYLSKNHNINNATKETLDDISTLRSKQRNSPVTLSLNDELELEFGFYLLRFNKYGIRKGGFGTGFPNLHLSPTFNGILNKEQNGFKRNVAPSFEDFKKFIATNKETFKKEIKDYLSNHN